MNWVEFQSVSLGYRRQAVLDGLTFSLKQGDAVGLAGPNGSGKTTILKGILGLLPPLSGEIRQELSLKRSIGYVPQRGAIDEVFPFSVEEIVEMGLYGHMRPWQWPTSEQRGQIRKTLGAVGLVEMAQKPFRDLSGGQKQRALLARALISDPRVLILDEPTHGLDVAQSQILLELLDRLRQEKGLSMIIVSHNLSELLEYTQVVLLLHQGKLVFSGPVKTLTDELLSGIYGIPVFLRKHLKENQNE